MAPWIHEILALIEYNWSWILLLRVCESISVLQPWKKLQSSNTQYANNEVRKRDQRIYDRNYNQ